MGDHEATPWGAPRARGPLRVGRGAAPPRGTVRLPGSKSFSTRALLLAAVAHGTSELTGLLRCDDTYHAAAAIRRLGAEVTFVGDAAQVVGVGGAWREALPGAGPLHLGGAGTLARFVPGLLAAAPAGAWVLDGSPQLRRRPMAPLLAALAALGADLVAMPPSPAVGLPVALPLTVRGGGLAGGRVEVDGRASSQFVSGVLLAAPLARAPVQLRLSGPVVQPAYVGMTAAAMAAFGVAVRGDVAAGELAVAPTPYRAARYAVAADASTACAFLALAAVTSGRVAVTPLAPDDLQPDLGLVRVLEQMGCTAIRDGHGVTLVGPGRLRGGFAVDLAAMSDQLPVLAALAAFADAPIALTGVAHVRGHESDRLAAMAANLRDLGAGVAVMADGLTVTPAALTGTRVRTFGDHRIAMAMALIGARVGNVVIDAPSCVGKTCPDFFARLAALGVPVEAA